MGGRNSKKAKKQVKKEEIKKVKKENKRIMEENKYIDDDNIIINDYLYHDEIINAKEFKLKKIEEIEKKEKEEEKEEEKIIINDFIKDLKIHPRKIKNIEKDIYNRLKYLNGFRCTKCLKKLIVEIERNKDDNILYIISKCKDNHIETKPITLFFAENKFEITEDFKFYDYISSSIRTKEKPVKRAIYIRRYGEYYYEDEYLFDREDETYFICSKCKKIFDLKKSNFDKIEHEHLLFKYSIIGDYGISDNYGWGNHYFEIKDLNYLEQKVKLEKMYIDELKDILNKYNLEEKYKSNLEEIELEIKFFQYFYNSYINQKHNNSRYFQNLFNIFNHQIIPFKLDENDLDKKEDLNHEIKQINNKLLSIYSLNTFEKKEKIVISKYEQHTLKPNGSVFISISLNKPYFASGGIGLFIYKIEDNPNKEEYKKHIITLVNQVSQMHILSMIYLGNEKILSGGINKGISIIQFDKDYKSYNYLLKIDQNKTINNIIQIKRYNFISLEEKRLISKLVLYVELNKIEKVIFLKIGENIINICEINKNFYAYQTNKYICIVNINTFKEKRRIKYEYGKNIYKYNDEIIGAISDNQNQIDFFDIEKGGKVFEIKSNYIIHGFIKSKRAKEDIITIIEHSSYCSGYGIVQDYSKDKNEWKEISNTGSTWTFYLRHIYEMDDFTILVSGQKELYALFYPLVNSGNIFIK